MDEQKAYPSDLGTARAAQQSPLSLLIDTQDKTGSLLNVLAEKLSPVSNPHPVDSKERIEGGYHINTALNKQQDINLAIQYLIETVVV